MEMKEIKLQKKIENCNIFKVLTEMLTLFASNLLRGFPPFAVLEFPRHQIKKWTLHKRISDLKSYSGLSAACFRNCSFVAQIIVFHK